MTTNRRLASYLKGKICKDNTRYESFLLALRYLKERNAKVIVETGTSRYGDTNCAGDGCSTLIFANWAKQNDVSFYSVDISEEALKNASKALGDLNASVHLTQSDSVEFLAKFNQPIDFLYLDSYDFEIDNPASSQEHHLKEIIAAYPHLTDNSFIMIDDCDLPYGGKGKLVIDYLLKNDWKIVFSGYQVILAK